MEKNYLDEDQDVGEIPFSEYGKNCLDPRYMEEDLPDDFCILILPKYLSNDTELLFPKENMMIGGRECASVGSIDVMGKDPVIMIGAKEVDKPKYRIGPDFLPCKIVLKWYGDRMNGRYYLCPYIPPANPSVPGTAREKTVQFASIDLFMHNKGAMIYDPHYEFEEKHDTSTYITPKPHDKKDEKNHVDKCMSDNGYTFIFSGKTKIPKRYSEYRMAYMAFNPMHPMAPPYIDHYTDDGNTIRGEYRWGRRLKKFEFNRRSKAYRLHSEIWYLLFPSHYYMGMFDIVSNFDILHYLPELRRLYDLRKYTFAPIKLVEGMYYPGVFQGLYSPLHYFNVKSEQEKKEMYQIEKRRKMYTFYCNQGIDLELIGESYNDVTSLYDLVFQSSAKYDLSVVKKDSGISELRILKGERYNKYMGNPDIFVEFSIRFKRFKVYRKGKDKDFSNRFFIFVKGAYFIGSPRNHEGSLMFHPKLVSFDQFVRETQAMTDNDEYVRSLVFCDYETIEQTQIPQRFVSYDIISNEIEDCDEEYQIKEKKNKEEEVPELKSLLVDLDNHHQDQGKLNREEDDDSE
jgi:hypothetical protein